MKVIVGFPPLYREINETFNVRGKPVIFTFSQTIFNPSRIKVTPELIAHETIHSLRQGDDPENWWAEYLVNTAFRLAEELPAHVEEFRVACQRLTQHKAQQRALHQIAARLSSSLYGSLIEYHDARREIAANL